MKNGGAGSKTHTLETHSCYLYCPDHGLNMNPQHKWCNGNIPPQCRTVQIPFLCMQHIIRD